MNLGAMGIEHIGVIGAGQMGRGIAQLAASHGLEVTLVDSGRDLAERGRGGIAQQLARLADKQKITPAERDQTMARIKSADLYAGELESVDFVVEAATESFDVKREIFGALDQACRGGVILATNTSSISITAIGAVVKRPDRVIGMHFMNPPPLMKLVEIVRAVQTSDETYAITRALAERMGKKTTTTHDAPGFLVNRILIPMLCEACFALQEGVGSAEDIDTGARLGLNHPMGPLELSDLIGLDTVLAIVDVLHHEIGDDKYRAPTILRNLVAAGWLGRKTGRGFYMYDDRGNRSAAPASTR
jgi:3-hydroxybutyryl-CoA dehydrogenase